MNEIFPFLRRSRSKHHIEADVRHQHGNGGHVSDDVSHQTRHGRHSNHRMPRVDVERRQGQTTGMIATMIVCQTDGQYVTISNVLKWKFAGRVNYFIMCSLIPHFRRSCSWGNIYLLACRVADFLVIHFAWSRGKSGGGAAAITICKRCPSGTL